MSSSVSEDASRQASADKKLSKSIEHSEIMNGLQDSVVCSAGKLAQNADTLNDGFISDISSEPFIDSENGSLASCEGSTTGETLSFKDNFLKDLKTAYTKVNKSSEEVKDKEVAKNSQEERSENEVQGDEEKEKSREQSSSLDVFGKDDEENEEEKNGEEEGEDLAGEIKPVAPDEADDVSQSNESLQEPCDTTEIPTKSEGTTDDLDSDKQSKPSKEKSSETTFEFFKKGDLKSRKKASKRSSDDNPEEKQSGSAGLVQKKRKKRLKKGKKGISLPVLEVGKLLEKCEISEEPKKTEDKPSLLDKETETDKLDSNPDIADKDEKANTEDRADVQPVLLDKETETETEKQSSDHDDRGEEREVSEDQLTEDLPDKEPQAEKLSSDHDSADQKESEDSEDHQTEDVPVLLDKETKKEELSSDQDIADQKQPEDSEDPAEELPGRLDKETKKSKPNSDRNIAEADDAEDLPVLLDKETKKEKKEKLSSDHDISDQKEPEVLKDRAEELPGRLDIEETKKSKPSSDRNIAETDDSEDDMPLVNIVKQTRKSKTKKMLACNPVPPLPNGHLDEVDDYDVKNTCQTVTSCFVSLTRLTDEVCKEANIASVGCTIWHPTDRQCYVRLQRLTQACSILVQSKCSVRLNRLPSSMIPPFGKLAFESDVAIRLDVGPLTRTVDEEDERDLDSSPVTRTVGTKDKQNTPVTRRAKRLRTNQ